MILGGHLAARAMNMRPTLRKAYDKVFETFDVLIMPTIPFVAPELPSYNMRLSGTIAINYIKYAGLPSVSISSCPCHLVSASASVT